MKKLLYLALFIPALQFAQVIIGTGKTAITNKSVSLEFGTEPRGIALPMATNAARCNRSRSGHADLRQF